MKKPVQSFNFWYTFFRPLVEFSTRCHYHRLVIRGRENIPTDGSYIYAPCHQNALMEPLAILCTTTKPVVFVARADIFAKPAIAAALHFLKIMPIYRIRDGKDNLGKNQEIFDNSRDVLLDGVPFCIMAEGRHNDKHQLLPLVKGLFRIAGETQNRMGEKPLYIVPTGIDYDEYERPFSNLVINFGKPVPVQPFMQTYNENEALALNQMRETMQEAMSAQMLDIKSKTYYDEINALANACNKTVRKEDHLKNSPWNRFEVRRRIARRLDTMVADGCEKYAAMMHLGKEYRRVCAELHLNEKMPGEKLGLLPLCLHTLVVAALLLAVVWIPMVRKVVLFALLCYPMILLPTHLIPKKIIKDPQFRSSVNYGIRFALAIIYTVALGIVVGILKGFWMGVLAFDTAFVVAFFSGRIVCWLRGLYDNWRYRFLQLKHRDKIQYLDAIIDEICKSMKA